MRACSGVLFAVLLAAAAPTFAQNAIGDGRALDNNLQQGGSQNPIADQPDYRARNNLITGNAPGLSGFKGNVGYRAPGDFQGSLGSDNLFQFHTRSLPSGQTAPWRIDYGSLPVYRSMTPATAGQISSGKINTLVPLDAARASNPIYNLPDAGQTSSTDAINSLSARRYDGRALELDASPLLGLRLKPRGGNDVDIHIRGPQSSDTSDAPGNASADPLQQERAGGPPQSLIQRLEALEQRDAQNADPNAPQDEPVIDESDVYFQLLKKVRDNRAAQADTAAALAARGVQANVVTDGEAPATAGVSNIADFAKLIDYQAAALDTLAGSSDEYIDKTLRSAEANLQAGRYFDAEHDYRAVLQLQPGHPMARVGLVHSQIGVGMILTAGHNLRHLFTRHPELIAARYDAHLLPDSERLVWAQKQLETMMQRDARRLEPALLLAYLHYQASRTEAMRAAIDEAHKRAPEDSLPELLRMVWDKQGDGSQP